MKSLFTVSWLLSCTAIVAMISHPESYDQPCIDNHRKCHNWAIRREYEKNDRWMNQNCKHSCKYAYTVPAHMGDKRVWIRVTAKNSYFIAPYHIQVFNYNTSIFCGGAAIAPHFMITAAHCVEKLIAPDNISFHVGIGSLIKEDGILLHISKIIIHKNYLNNTDVKGDRMSHDIALIYVKDKISDENIIGLANRAERVGESGKLTGFDEYKDLRDYSRFPVKLQEAYFTILPIRAEGAPTMFFTSGRGGQGDGGAPFVWEESGKPVLGGIYTGMAGLEDNTVRPQFIRIIDFKHWITYQMKKTL